MITVFGSINMDLIATAKRLPKPGETVTGESFSTAAGGKGANQALAARRAAAEAREQAQAKARAEKMAARELEKAAKLERAQMSAEPAVPTKTDEERKLERDASRGRGKHVAQVK